VNPNRSKSFFAASTCAALLYLPFISKQYDLNGVAEAIALEAGGLFNQNHLLYGWIGFGLWKTFSMAGYREGAFYLLQILSAVVGALSIGLAYLFYSSISARFFAATAAFWLATTLSYWRFSTDAAYINLAASCVLGATVAEFTFQSQWRHVVAGICLGFGVLAWQANVFILPIFAFAVFARPDKVDQDRRRSIALVVAPCLAFVAGTYFVAGVIATQHGNSSELLDWILSHRGGKLASWGTFSGSRVTPALASAVMSITPTGPTSAQIQSVSRVVLFFNWLCLASAVGLCAYGLTLADRAKRAMLAWLIACYFAYLLFIVWWDPFEPKWFVIPNIFLGAVACILLSPLVRSNVATLILAVCVALNASVNFSTVIWPNRIRDNSALDIATCVAGAMQNPKDLFLATDWDWDGYLRYFGKRDVISLVAEAAYFGDKEKMLTAVKDKAIEAQGEGANVFMTDIHAYPEAHIEWLQTETGLSVQDVEKFQGEAVMTCGGRRILQLKRLFR